jgi:predicted deacylase
MTVTKFVLGTALGVLLGAGGGYWWWHATATAPGPAHAPEPAAGAHAADGEVAEPGKVELDDATVQTLGIVTAAVVATSLTPTIAAPGRLVADPAFATSVRAPLAGHLIAGPQPLPRLGAAVAAGTVVALLQPRLSASEGADLAQRRAQAIAERDTATRAVEAAQRDLERQKTLHADGNAASRRVVEQAEVELAKQQAALASALQTLLSLPASGPAAVPLLAPRSGIVDAIQLHLGEDVDAGAVLLQLSDPSHLLARVEVPAAAPVDAVFPSARIELLGETPRTIEAARAGWVDGNAGDRAVLLTFAAPDDELRAGLPVIAHLPRPGGAQQGLLLPEAAILRRGDGAHVFVRTDVAGGKTKFQRLPVTLDAPAPGGWLSLPRPGGPTLGSELVIGGAGTLLSIEREHATDAEAGG